MFSFLSFQTFKYKITRHKLWLATSAVNVGIILLSKGNYISREIHECVSSAALLKPQTVIRVSPASGKLFYIEAKYSEN